MTDAGRIFPSSLRRSCLVVPGHKNRMHEKAAVTPADEVVFDLEDAVPDVDKNHARTAVLNLLAEDCWRKRTVAVRMNGVGTDAHDADVIALAQCDHPALSVVLPKVESSDQIEAVASRLGPTRPIQALIESPRGIVNAPTLAGHEAVISLVIGYADLTASLGRRPIWGIAESWIVQQEAVILAARAAEIEAIDGPFFRVRDGRGLAAAAVTARAAGFDGKWAIHPDQVSIINDAFAVTKAELAWAHDVLNALADEGATSVRGAMVDEAMARRARRLVWLLSQTARSERVEERRDYYDQASKPAHRVAAPFFDELRTGQMFRSPGVTITPGHAATHQAIIGDRLRLALDAPLAEAVTGQTGVIAHPMLVCDVAIGQSTTPSGRVLGNLFYRGLGARPVHIGTTLRTQTEVVARRNASSGRGIVALRVTSNDERGATILDFWRCPLLPARPDAASKNAVDDLETVGTAADPLAYVPREWNLAPMREAPLGSLFPQLAVGDRFEIEAGETVSAAPELARLSLNLAMTHTDRSAGVYGERLVYGGHVIGIAAAHVVRALPDLATVLVWHSCDHLAPTFEGDILNSRIEITGVESLDDGGLVELHVRTSARTIGEPSRDVLDWKLVVLMP